MARLIFATLLVLFAYGIESINVGEIKYMHVVLMNHLDVGFDGIDPELGFALNVVNKYFDVYYPLALNISATFRANNDSRGMIYTTHPWLVSLYVNCTPDAIPSVQPGVSLHCPTPDALAAFEDAILRGDISWHAFPFNTETEFFDSSLFHAAIDIARDLDRRYGKPVPTRTMSQRDVPGVTRAAVPLLARRGIAALSVGVNGASAPPAVPKAFRWVDVDTDTEVLGMWHPGGYGGWGVADVVAVDGLPHALAMAVNGDNAGPFTYEQTIAIYEALEGEFPNATVFASTWDAFVEQLETVRKQLPVITGEIGDTWLYGVSSDPYKTAAFRAAMRARRRCVDDGRCDLSDPRMKLFDRLMVKLPEHTWGMDIKTFLGDWENWSNEQFERVRKQPNYVNVTLSWIEQREYLSLAIEQLGPLSELAKEIELEIDQLQPYTPSTNGFSKISNFSTVFYCGDLQIAFNATVGGISLLADRSGRRVWAVPDGGPGLAQFSYRTYNTSDYDVFMAEYFYGVPLNESWPFEDFGKPNLTAAANPLSTTWWPVLEAVWALREPNSVNSGDVEEYCHFITKHTMAAEAVTYYGAPKDLWLEIRLDRTTARAVDIVFQWHHKTPTRLPEALFLSFVPALDGQAKRVAEDMESVVDNSSIPLWLVRKLDSWISPLDVVINGSQHLHVVGEDLLYIPDAKPVSNTDITIVDETTEASAGSLKIESPDAALVRLGDPTAFPTPLTSAPDMTKGAHFVLCDNLWGTNYIMWYPFLPEEDSTLFRFRMTLE